jgi:SAM-dependent methyltransferase
MKKKDWYENWFSSAWYKILYRDRDVQEAEQFVERLISYLHPPKGSRMLDIACGEGRYAGQLAGKGYDVTGIDLSYQSIRKAKEMEVDNLHFFVHDMRFPFYINYFDYAFNFFTSFGYFANDRDHVMAAKSFASALKKDGLLVIDYLNVAYVLNNLVPEEVVEKEGIRFDIKRSLIDKHIIKNIVVTDREGALHHYAERVAAFSLEDFLQLFRKAGMELVNTYGNYDMGIYNTVDSERLIMIFKK